MTDLFSFDHVLPDGREAVIEVHSYTPGTRDYFSTSFGNWLPGDDAEAEWSAVVDGKQVELSDDDYERVADEVYSQCDSYERGCAENEAIYGY